MAKSRKDLPPMMDQKTMQDMALIMAVNCVRNTIIEDYHAAGKISDPEMAAFNKEVANKLFTFLTHLFGRSEDSQDFLEMLSAFYPSDWDKPKLDENTVRALEMYRERKRRSASS